MIESEKDTFLIKFMRIGYWVDFFIYPLTALLLFIASLIWLKVPILSAILLLFIGFCIWGIAEYFTHRYLFHHAPLFKTGHGEHHKRPKLHIGTPFFVTLPVYFLISWLIALSLGYGVTAVLLAGFIMGYFGYLLCHHIVHNSKILPGTFLYRYKKFHDVHHYKQNVNFGVSWQFWDKIFGTYKI